MRLVQFTVGASATAVNADHVVYVVPVMAGNPSQGTYIYFAGGLNLRVKETYQQVMDALAAL